MQRLTRKDFRANIERWNEHHGLNLELYTSISSAIIYKDGGNAIVQGRNLREADLQIRAWIRGWIAGRESLQNAEGV